MNISRLLSCLAVLLITHSALAKPITRTLEVWITCHTPQANMYLNGSHQYTFPIPNEEANNKHYQKLLFEGETQVHELVIAKEGYLSDTLRFERPAEDGQGVFVVDLIPRFQVPQQPWTFEVEVARSAFYLSPRAKVAQMVTRHSGQVFTETWFGRNQDRFEGLLNEIPIAVQEQLINRGFVLPTQRETPEEFFHKTQASDSTIPKVKLGVKITEMRFFQESNLQNGYSVASPTELISVWYLYDPVADQVVYQKEVHTYSMERYGTEFVNFEDSFYAAIQSAFEDLLTDLEFVGRAQQLGYQAIQLASGATASTPD